MSETQRYQVVERIAAGGMAEVYRGESAGIEGFRKKVAIKRVLPKLSANREFINMFLDEARLCAYLNHSRCVQVFDIGQGAGAHFIVMEYVDGADLKGVLDHLASQNLLIPVEVACLITVNICEGLAYAHEACDHAGQPLNIVHRDISPHNVLITRYGEVKLVDFGLARASSHLTEDDEDIVKGKFGYLAPEVTLGKAADRRVDIFAAGILLWEMLAGRRLFLGKSDIETFKLVQAAEVPDVRRIRNDVSNDLVRVLAKALARDPDQRYRTADDLARDLSVVLLRQSRPVTYQDVAHFVRQAADERDRKKRAEGRDTKGIIGDLILDTLHDFSGDLGELTPDVLDRESRLGTRGVEAATHDFVDPSAWGLDALFDEIAPSSSRVPAPAGAPAPPRTEGAAARAEAVPPHAGRARPRAEAASAPLPPPERPPAPPPSSLPPRQRVQGPPPEHKDGPFWRRWFGS